MIIFGATVLLLAGCGTEDEVRETGTESDVEETEEVTSTGTETEEVVEEYTESDETEEDEDRVANEETEEELIQGILEILETTYTETGEAVYIEEDKMFKIIPYDNSYNESVIVAREGNQQVLNEWNNFTESFIGLYDSIEYVLGDSYTLSLANKENPSSSILIIRGNYIYDAVTDEFGERE